MNLEDFRARIKSIAVVEGDSYFDYDDIAAFNSFINECLSKLSIEAEAFHSNSIAFTPTVGETSFDLRGSSFAKRIWKVDQVTIDGATLHRINGPNIKGRSSEEEVTQATDLHNATSGKPTAWWFEAPARLRFDKPFDQVYADCFVSGNYLHTELLDDNQALEFPDEALLSAAKYVAGCINSIGASGEGLQNYARLKSESITEAKDLASRLAHESRGAQIRGYKTKSRYTLS